LGAVVGRVIGPGPQGKGLEGVTVRLRGNNTTFASAVTDSSGTFRLSAPGDSYGLFYPLDAECAGYDPIDGFVSLVADSVIVHPDLVMWPVRYFDWTAYREFMSAPSIQGRAKSLHATAGAQDRDSTLLTAYRYYLNPTGPLVLRTRITPPFDDCRKKWPNINEYGEYLFIDKGRCRFMEVQMWYPTTGMRLWDVDSIQLGFYTKGGFYKRGPDAFRGADWFWGPCLRIFLHPNGVVDVSSR
jgi:hypothetical protein